jgi:hypothetical protein
LKALAGIQRAGCDMPSIEKELSKKKYAGAAKPLNVSKQKAPKKVTIRKSKPKAAPKPTPKSKKTTSSRRKLATPAIPRKKTKTMDIKKFAVGSVYEKRFIGDSDLKVKYKCTQRTASTATFQSVTRSSEVITRKIKISGDSEYIVDGSYSMAPAIYASSLVKPTSSRRKIAAPAKAKTTKKAVNTAVKPTPKPMPKKRKTVSPLTRIQRAARLLVKPTGIKADGTLKKGYTRLKNGDVVKKTLVKKCTPTPKKTVSKSKKRK